MIRVLIGLGIALNLVVILFVSVRLARVSSNTVDLDQNLAISRKIAGDARLGPAPEQDTSRRLAEHDSDARFDLITAQIQILRTTSRFARTCLFFLGTNLLLFAFWFIREAGRSRDVLTNPLR